MKMSGLSTSAHFICAWPSKIINLLRQTITWGAFSMLPAMFAANGPPPGVPPVNQPVNVQVINTEAAPVQTQDVDNPAFQPFSWSVTRDFNPGNVGASATFTVPNGKRLVIEFVSFQYILPPGQTPRSNTIVINNPGTAIFSQFRFFMNRQATTPTEEIFVGSSPTRLYASAGETVSLTFDRTISTGIGHVQVGVSGYYVNVP